MSSNPIKLGAKNGKNPLPTMFDIDEVDSVEMIRKEKEKCKDLFVSLEDSCIFAVYKHLHVYENH